VAVLFVHSFTSRAMTTIRYARYFHCPVDGIPSAGDALYLRYPGVDGCCSLHLGRCCSDMFYYVRHCHDDYSDVRLVVAWRNGYSYQYRRSSGVTSSGLLYQYSGGSIAYSFSIE